MALQGQRNIKIVIWLSQNICAHTVMPKCVDLQASEGSVCVCVCVRERVHMPTITQNMFRTYICVRVCSKISSPSMMCEPRI